MSLTARAREASVTAALAWRLHKASCPSCFTPRYENCTAGQQLQAAARKARAEHVRQRELDRQPIDGQGVMW